MFDSEEGSIGYIRDSTRDLHCHFITYGHLLIIFFPQSNTFIKGNKYFKDNLLKTKSLFTRALQTSLFHVKIDFYVVFHFSQISLEMYSSPDIT